MEPTITPPIRIPAGPWLSSYPDVGTSVILLFEVLEVLEVLNVAGIGKVGEEAVELGEFAFKQPLSSEFPTILVSKVSIKSYWGDFGLAVDQMRHLASLDYRP